MSKKTGYSNNKLKAFGIEITGDDAWAFLEEKTASQACRVCDYSPQTLMLTGPADLSALVITTQDAAPNEEGHYHFVPEPNTRSLPVFGLWCPNCGHVQLHTLGTLSSWIKKQPKDDAEDGQNEQPR